MADPKANLILSAVDRTSEAFSSIDRRVRTLNQVAAFATRTFAGLGAVIGAGELVQAADTYTLLTNRLRLVTRSSEELARVQQQLFASAQNTRSSYEATVELYARIARSSDQLGLSQSRLITLTETINQAIQISGASSQEAAAGLVQFAQGLASGALRGDELRSVLEQMPRLAQAIAAGMGITVGRLRELGAEGQLTAETVIRAIESQASVLREEFGKTEATVGQAVDGLGNSLLRLIGKINEATDASRALSGMLNAISQSIDDVAGKSIDRQIELLDQRIAMLRAAQQAGSLGGNEILLERALEERRQLEIQRRIESMRTPFAERRERFQQEGEQAAQAFAQGFDLPKWIGLRFMDEKGAKPVLDFASMLEDPRAGMEEAAERRRQQLAAELEAVRVGTLSREEVEREAIARRLEILRTSHEQGLIDLERFYELSSEVAARGQERLTEISNKGASDREKFEKLSASRKAQHILGTLSQLTAGAAQHSKRAFELNKLVATAEAIVNTAAGVTQALRAYPPPLSFAMAAAVAAAGAVQIQAIRATTFGGGTTPSLAGSTGQVGGQPVPVSGLGPVERSESRRSTTINVTVNGSVIGEGGRAALAEDLATILREHMDDTDDVIINTNSRQAATIRG